MLRLSVTHGCYYREISIFSLMKNLRLGQPFSRLSYLRRPQTWFQPLKLPRMRSRKSDSMKRVVTLASHCALARLDRQHYVGEQVQRFQAGKRLRGHGEYSDVAVPAA